MSRILHIGKYYPPFAGGIEHFLADLIPLQQQTDEVAALVHDHYANFSRFFTAAQMEQHAPDIYRCPSYGRLLYAPVSPQFPFWLHKIIKDWQPDLLHLHLPNTSAFWALLLPAARRLPWVVHWHSDVTSQHDSRLNVAYQVYKPWEQAVLRRASAVIATSPPYLESSQALQAWRAKTQVIPLGLSLDRVPTPSAYNMEWARKQWSPQYPMRLLSVGRLTYYKGYEVLIRAVATVPEAQLCIVGEGDQRADLTLLIEALQLQDRVKLLGHCSNAQLPALYSTCDSFCLPSLERTEAFGMVLLEAMRYQCSVIASAIEGAGVTWIVQEGETGLFVPPNDVAALASAIQQLASQPDLRRQLAIQGQQRFLALFGMQPVAKAIKNLYQQVLS